MEDLTDEVWKPVLDFEGLYEVSNKGRIRSVDRKVIGGAKGYTRKAKKMLRKPWKTEKGYLKVPLYKNNKQYMKRVHRLVAQAFIPNPDKLPEINHIDGVKDNNNVENLEWCTGEQNRRHYFNKSG